MRNRPIITISFIIALLLITGCGASQPASSAPPQQISIFESSSQPLPPAVDPEIEKQKQQEKEQEQEQFKDGSEFMTEDTGIEFTTPYIKLKYPEELQGKVELLHNTEQAKYSVTFKVKDQDITLFSITLSPDESGPGFKLGKLKDQSAGTVNVFTDVNEISPDGMDEETYNELCSMQERINDLIGQFSEDERFDFEE